MNAMGWADGAKLLGFAANILLFVSSLIAQRFQRLQAQAAENAALQCNRSGAPATQPPLSGKSALTQAGARLAALPYFHRSSYVLFCIGFGALTLSSLIDLVTFGTLERLWCAFASGCQNVPTGLP
jgi:hypothetical protein